LSHARSGIHRWIYDQTQSYTYAVIPFIAIYALAGLALWQAPRPRKPPGLDVPPDKWSTSNHHGLEPMPVMPAIQEEVAALDDAVETVQLASRPVLLQTRALSAEC
jgi:hypothetical protein